MPLNASLRPMRQLAKEQQAGRGGSHSALSQPFKRSQCVPNPTWRVGKDALGVGGLVLKASCMDQQVVKQSNILKKEKG